MRAINHALTGAVIGITIGQPLIAIPAAVLSHFVLDSIPHHGRDKAESAGKLFVVVLVLDAIACLALVAILAYGQPRHWLLAAFCAFLATAPDFMWVNRFRRARKHQSQPARAGLLRFHKGIQWFEHPIGWVVEVTWFGGFVWLLRAIWR
jgi:hypothetical protein